MGNLLYAAQIFLVLTIVSTNIGCYFNAHIAPLTDDTISSNICCSVKVSHLPTSVPEGYPYYATPTINNLADVATYSLDSNTCSNLNINSSSGLLTGILNHLDSESCSYRVKATVSNQEYLSEPVTLTFTAPLAITFSKSAMALQRSGGFSSVDVNISPSPPFDSYFEYSILSVTGSTADKISGMGESGSFSVYSGVGTKTLSLEVPGSASLTTPDYQILKITTGSTTNKPIVDLSLYINTSPDFDHINSGTNHTCAISVGRLYCWGNDSNGQIGNGATTGDVSTPSQIGTSTTWQSLAGGGTHTCGIDAGRLYCWGNDSLGQIGNGATTGNITSPLQIGASTTWQSVAAGANHTCGIDAGKLYCWGDDWYGQIGNGATTGNITSPSQIGTSTTWQKISAGSDFTYGIELNKLFGFGDKPYIPNHRQDHPHMVVEF